MPPTDHMIIIDRPVIIVHLLLQIATLTKAAAVERHKHSRQFKKSFSGNSSQVKYISLLQGSWAGGKAIKSRKFYLQSHLLKSLKIPRIFL